MNGILTLIRPGLRTLIVDAGRPHTRSLGVPLGGAADRFSHALGNALVGNSPTTAALEITLYGPTLHANVPLACVLTGAPFAVHTPHRVISPATTFTLEPGDLLEIGGTAVGVRGYLCVQGGMEAPLVLGSRCSLTPLVAGSSLAIRSGRIHGRCLSEPEPLSAGTSVVLHTLPGGQAAWFAEQAFFDKPFRIGAASDRMGLRLVGDALIVPPREIASEPVCPGTVQVTRDGQCIVLGVDGQTIGGYPKIAQVIAADLDLLGQLRPGATVTFCSVTPREAERRWQRRSEDLRRMLSLLAVTLDTESPAE